MAFTPHSYLTFYGTLGTGSSADIWQFGIRIAQKAGDGSFQPLRDLTGYATAIAGGVGSAWRATSIGGSTTSGIPAAWANMTQFKVANIGADGKYSGATDLNGGPNPVVSGGAGAGTSTVGALPALLTLACSFTTGAATKYAKNGRVYAPLAVPAPGNGVERSDSTTIGNAVSWIKLLLTNISKPAATGSNPNPIRPVVASKHGGEIFEVTGVRVGDVIDVQRRRKNKLHEVYTASAWS